MAQYRTKSVFATNLAGLLETKNTSQAGLARLLGVSKSTVSSWCNGEKMPRMDKIETMAAHFGVPKSVLLEGSDSGDGFDEISCALMEECRALSAASRTQLLELARHLAALEAAPEPEQP